MSALVAAARLVPLCLVAPLGPTSVRLAVAAALVALVAPAASHALGADAAGAGAAAEVAAEMIVEAAIGLALGLSTAALVGAAEAAGSLVDGVRSRGRGRESEGTLRRAFQSMALAVFASVGGARLWVDAVARSYQILPPGRAPTAAAGSNLIIDIVAQLWLSALELAAPVVAALLVAEVFAALIERFVPSLGAILGGASGGRGGRELWGLGALAVLLVGSLAALALPMERVGQSLAEAARRLGS